MEQNPFGTGAIDSYNDPRTVKHETLGVAPLVKGGTEYLPEDIEHQHIVGICTAISRVQLRQKQTGKKYSPDFQYLLQKKFVDGAWFEGSSIFAANKIAKNYGFLPLELFTHVTEEDRSLPYYQYEAKLRAIPDNEIQRLLKLCVDKIAGYAQINISDPQGIAKAITESEGGILCRYETGDTWYRPSWQEKDISPLRKPVPATGGHAIIMSKFDYTKTALQTLANTWGTQWCRKGSIDIDWSNYSMTEAWIDLPRTPVIETPFVFTKDLSSGMTNLEVKELQKFLNTHGSPVAPTGPGSKGNETNYFGKLTQKALIDFQSKNSISPAVGYFGPKTRSLVNLILKND